MSKKLWGGRFKYSTDKEVELFTSSIEIDKELYKYDIKGSTAHVKMLKKQKIISPSDESKILKGLKKIEKEIDDGKFIFDSSLEDIHMNIEHALTKKIGNVGKKVHTARSRNDQVVTDMRLYTKDSLKNLHYHVKKLIDALIKKSEKSIKIIIPFYTHLQKAQPILASHYLNSFIEMFLRDLSKIEKAYEVADSNPLGSCAGSGTSFNIDREYTSKLLGFKRTSRNSLDSVSDRDFITDSIFTCSQIMMHLSRFSEDLILWNSYEFNYIKINDKFTTGSSIMPQKKNPDVLELIRGKCSQIYGNLINIMVNLKGLPSTYNRDLQEDKIPLFSSIKTCTECISIFSNLINSITFNENVIKNSIENGFMTATDLADYLVKKGLTFRDAHSITGKLVLYCEDKNIKLSDLKIKEYKKFSNKIDIDIYDYIKLDNSVNSKKSLGGTSLTMVKKEIKNYKNIINKK